MSEDEFLDASEPDIARCLTICDLAGVGEMGIANTTRRPAIAAALFGGGAERGPGAAPASTMPA